MRIAAMIAVASLGLGFATAATAQEPLAKSSGCLNCHAIDTKKVGPSFKDVSAKYKGKPDAESALVAKLSGGKEHPAVKASGDDLKGLVKWVLSQ